MECESCKRAITPDARFCPHCGQPLPSSGRASQQAAVLPGQSDADELKQLRDEKTKLSSDLQALLDTAAHRELSTHERRVWAEMRTRWKEVSDAITAKMEYHAARRDHDRRSRERRVTDRRVQFAAIEFPDRRESTERRKGDRRSGTDRRDPHPETPP